MRARGGVVRQAAPEQIYLMLRADVDFVGILSLSFSSRVTWVSPHSDGERLRMRQKAGG